MLAAVRGVASSFFNPASTGAIAQVASQDRKQEVFALFSLAGNIAEVAGPSLAGVALFIVDPGWILVFDAGTFLVSAILIAASGPLGTPAGTGGRPTLIQLREGWRYVTKQTWLAVLIASASLFQLFLLPSLNVLGPLVAVRHLGGAPSWAFIVTALGVGSIAGSLLAMVFKPRRPLLVGYGLLLFGAGPTLLLLAIPAPTPIIALSEFVSGMVISFFTALEYAVISRYVPASLLSRVDSINRFGSMALRPIGMAVVGPVAETIGVQLTLVVVALLNLLAVAWPLTIQAVRQLRSDDYGVASCNGVAK